MDPVILNKWEISTVKTVIKTNGGWERKGEQVSEGGDFDRQGQLQSVGGIHGGRRSLPHRQPFQPQSGLKEGVLERFR